MSTEGDGGVGYDVEYDSTRHDPLKTFTVNEISLNKFVA